MIGNPPAVSNFNRLSSNSTGSSVTNRRFFPSSGLVLSPGGVVQLSVTILGVENLLLPIGLCTCYMAFVGDMYI